MKNEQMMKGHMGYKKDIPTLSQHANYIITILFQREMHIYNCMWNMLLLDSKRNLTDLVLYELTFCSNIFIKQAAPKLTL